MDEQVKSFQSEYPDIEVEHQYILNADLPVKILAAIAGGDPPEVFNISRSSLPEYASKKTILPLDDYLRREGINLDDLVYPSEAYHCRYNGTTYALPQAIGSGFFLFYYSKDTFEKAGLDPEQFPKTWKGLADANEKITRVADGKVETLGYDIHQADSISCGFDWLLYTNNGKLLTDDGKAPAFNTPEGLETLEWMLKFHEPVGGWTKVRDFTGANNEQTNKLVPMVVQGMLGMYNSNVSQAFILSTQYAGFKWGAGVVPYNGGNLNGKSITYDPGGWGTCIPTGAKNADAAWEWVKWNTIGPGNVPFLRAQMRPSPVRANTEAYGKDPEITTVNPYWHVFDETLANSVPLPQAAGWPRAREALTKRVEQALLLQMPAKQALDAAAQEVQRELARS
jgi:multiple sugar transport system substrate-binding protein